MKVNTIALEVNKRISRRTKEGMANAKAKGISLGRPTKDAKVIDEALKLYYGRKRCPIRKICELTGLSNATLYRYIEKLSYSEIDILRRTN